MAWSLKGSYVETCSCELMCPCNMFMDHGATYDFCRVTLAFNVRQGKIEGIDVGGLNAVAIADTPDHEIRQPARAATARRSGLALSPPTQRGRKPRAPPA
jgi:hypothetical protein